MGPLQYKENSYKALKTMVSLKVLNSTQKKNSKFDSYFIISDKFNVTMYYCGITTSFVLVVFLLNTKKMLMHVRMAANSLTNDNYGKLSI